MIIVIKNSDYSACGIGKVDIPIEISQDCLDIMALYPSGDTAESREKMQKFMNQLGYGISTSIWSRIKALYIPFFAATVSEALTDIISKSNGAIDSTTWISELEISNNGLQAKSSSSTVRKSVNAPFTTGAITSFGYSPVPSVKEFVEAALGGYLSSTSTYMDGDTQKFFSDRGDSKFRMSLLESTDANAKYYNIYDSGEDAVTVADTKNASVVQKKIILGSYNDITKNIPLRIFGWAENLTHEEGLTLKSAVINLVG